jgi:hypothetical protein
MFTWNPTEILGISWVVTEHTLNIKPGSRPIRQGLQRFNQEKRWAMGEELSWLLAACFIKEVQHPNWMANPVLVRKGMGNGECVLITQA